jgi:hypothetical protein
MSDYFYLQTEVNMVKLLFPYHNHVEGLDPNTIVYKENDVRLLIRAALEEGYKRGFTKGIKY